MTSRTTSSPPSTAPPWPHPHLDVRLCNFDEFDEIGSELDRPVDEPAACIWRGWMMAPERYSRFYEQCRRLNLNLITSPEAYGLMHCFPNAYKLMDPSDTPRITVFGDRMIGKGRQRRLRRVHDEGLRQVR